MEHIILDPETQKELLAAANNSFEDFSETVGIKRLMMPLAMIKSIYINGFLNGCFATSREDLKETVTTMAGEIEIQMNWEKKQ